MIRINQSLKSLVMFSLAALLAGCAIDSGPTEEEKQDDQISQSVNDIVQGDIGNPSHEGTGGRTPGSAQGEPTPIAAQSRPYAPQPQPWVEPISGQGNAPQPQPWSPQPASTNKP